VVDYTDREGKRRRETHPSKKLADKARLRIEVEVEAGTHVPRSEAVTVGEALDDWLNHCDDRARVGDRMRIRTAENFRNLADNHIRPKFGAVKLPDLRAADIQAWLNDLAHDRQKPRSQSLLKHLASILRMTLKYAVLRERLNVNVMTAAQIRIPGSAPSKKEIPTKDELRKLLALSGEVLGPGGVARYLRPLIYTAVFTGMRQGELRALRWENVDFDAAVIRVREGADQMGRIQTTKTLAGVRDIPLAPVVVHELRKWKLASQKLSRDGLVFVGNRGRMIQPACIQQSFARLQRRAFEDARALPEKPFFPGAKYNFHQLRHAAASLLIETGLPPKRIQQIMGHSTISMTFDRYGHLFDDQSLIQDAMSRIGSDIG